MYESCITSVYVSLRFCDEDVCDGDNDDNSRPSSDDEKAFRRRLIDAEFKKRRKVRVSHETHRI